MEIEDNELMQSGFSSIFSDPNTIHGGGNQPHHFWFYVQMGYESNGSAFPLVTAFLHETDFGSDNPAGNFSEDFILGVEGITLGKNLASGQINPGDVGNYVHDSLSTNSPSSTYWSQRILLVDIALGVTDYAYYKVTGK